MKNLVILIASAFVILLILIGFFFLSGKTSLQDIKSFEDCVNQGYPVMESYPRQCVTPDGQNFTEEIESPVLTGKEDLIVVTFPKSNEVISSPLEIKGEARGYWFFESSFPVYLKNENGEILASGIATADGDWMTEDFVPFTATLTFDQKNVENGILVLNKDNPSGLPENDDSLEIPVKFKQSNLNACVVTGCSGQICSDEEVVTTCEFKEEYACFKEAICEKQDSGECGWTETEEYNQCRQGF